MPINIEYLRHHWKEFFIRHGNPFRKKELNNKNQQL